MGKTNFLMTLVLDDMMGEEQGQCTVLVEVEEKRLSTGTVNLLHRVAVMVIVIARQAPSEEGVSPRPLGMELADRPAQLPVPVDGELCFALMQAGSREIRAKRKIKMREKIWDCFRLTSFLSYMLNSFVCKGVDRSSFGVFERGMTIWEDDIRVIEIYTTNDLSLFDVFLRGTSSWKVWTRSQEPCQFQIRTRDWAEQRPEYHPLKVFGRFFARKDHSPSLMVTLAFKDLYKRPWTDDNRGTVWDRLGFFVHNTPGWFHIVEQPYVENGVKTSETKCNPFCSEAIRQFTPPVDLTFDKKSASPPAKWNSASEIR